MTDRERQDAWLREHYARFPYGEQDENGVELSLLRENLRLTPAERLAKHNRALESVRELRRVGNAHRAKRDRQGP